MTELIMLGTGNALVTKCFNTCFILKHDKGLLMVDTGGGNGILKQLESAGINVFDVHSLYLTHAHTDHVMGAIWLMRKVINRAKDQGYEGQLHIYGHERVLMVVQTMCSLMLTKKDNGFIGRQIFLHVLKDRDTVAVEGFELQAFDILSKKEKQFGFRAKLPEGKILTCLGDEPYNEANAEFVRGADWLMCEAFCLYADREIFHPYEKNHVTALEAGKLAAQAGAAGIVIYHTEDKHLATRRQSYAAEAATFFKGRIEVPDDLEHITL